MSIEAARSLRKFITHADLCHCHHARRMPMMVAKPAPTAVAG